MMMGFTGLYSFQIMLAQIRIQYVKTFPVSIDLTSLCIAGYIQEGFWVSLPAVKKSSGAQKNDSKQNRLNTDDETEHCKIWQAPPLVKWWDGHFISV